MYSFFCIPQQINEEGARPVVAGHPARRQGQGVAAGDRQRAEPDTR